MTMLMFRIGRHFVGMDNPWANSCHIYRSYNYRNCMGWLTNLIDVKVYLHYSC